MTSFDSPFGGSPWLPQYGAFLFPEHLEETFGRDVIRSTWEAIDTAIPRRAIDALEAVLAQEHQADLRQVTADFHTATYTMDYQDADRDAWVQRLQASQIQDLQGDARSPQARPARHHRAVADSGRTARGSVADLQPGGVAYIDLTLPADDRGRMVVQVDTSAWGPDAAMLDARVITWSAFPARCNQQALPLEMGQGVGAVAVDLDNSGPCQFATLLISHTDPTARDSHPVSYTARFAAFIPYKDVDISTGRVTTVAGSDTEENVDGVGENAAFDWPVEMVVVDGFGYVTASGALRKVDLSSGKVSTLGTSQCPEGHRGVLATDGYYLFSVPCYGDDSKLLRITIATGATVEIGSGAGIVSLGMGPDGALYRTAYSHDSGVYSYAMLRIDPETGATSKFATLPMSGAFAADENGFWIGVSQDNLYHLDFTTRQVTSVAPLPIWVGELISADDYLYTIQDARVVRIAKADGAVTAVAGGPYKAGYADGVGSDAGMPSPKQLSSDGTDLYLTDYNRIRRITAAPPLPPRGLSSSADATVEITTGEVSTVAGSELSENVDGTGEQAAFALPAGIVVADGFGYVESNGAIRKLDLASGNVSTLAVRECAGSARGQITTDGYYLFSVSCAGDGGRSPMLLRTAITTGTLADISYLSSNPGLVLGPDRCVYTTSSVTYRSTRYPYPIETRHFVDRVDPDTGEGSRVLEIPAAGVIAADSHALWIGADKSLLRIDFVTKVVTTIATLPMSLETLTSSGDYLYASDAANRILRLAKTDGTMTIVAGGSAAGYADGVRANAGFTSIRGLTSDGTDLFATDGNRVRRISDSAG